MKHKKKLIAGGILVVLVLAALVFIVINKQEETKQPTQKYYSQLTGREVAQDVSERPILGVMLENSKAARPQTGLDSAGIVFEAVTEGGITRYLALYQENTPEIIGPVRSLRTHFLNWLMGFDASVAHVGGSGEALQLADQRNAKSLSQFKYAEPYYRDNSRASPHNMYTQTRDLRELQNELDHQTSQFAEIPRREASPINNEQSQDKSQQASEIEINFSSALYRAEFRYDPASNSYTRYLSGEPHIDKATDKPITVKNLVVIKAKGLSAGLDVIGSGEALIFNDGKVEKVRWQQNDFQKRIKFFDDNNNEVALLRGDSWFAGVGSDRPVKF